MVKSSPAIAGDARDAGSIPGEGTSPGGASGNPLQYSCLENSMDKRSPTGYSPRGCKQLDVTECHESVENIVQRQTPFTTLGMNPKILHVSQAAKFSGKPLTESTHCSQPTFPSYLEVLTVRGQLSKENASRRII